MGGKKGEEERKFLKFNRATEAELLAFFEGLTNKQDTLKKIAERRNGEENIRVNRSEFFR